ncbi:MAG: FKBP-type peptidyl-prolyl cis-trans isomerase [Bacteroidales bacterium]|nr:FKBP-type peptidyl-prolyl cis-trans isomerase [Candidatus Physcousia equi]
MKKTILLFCAAALCMSGAQAKDKKTKKTKKSEAPVEVVDTISSKDFSLLAGAANTMGLKDYLVQRMGIDTTFMSSFLEGFDTKEMTDADKALKARLTGIEIRQQVEKEIIPQLSQQVGEEGNIVDNALFVEGFRNAIAGKMPAGVSMDSAQMAVRKNMEYYHKAQMERKYGPVKKEGEEFLKKNAKEKDVKVTPSGLQYKVLVQGNGEVPTATQKVKVNYRGTLIDGTEFDSSYKRNEPATFGCNQVIKGWTEALTMMPVGSKWMLYIPQELAYGERESGKIPPFSTLIFEVELLEIVK